MTWKRFSTPRPVRLTVGSIGTPELYAEIVNFCRKYDILLVHDNAYSDIIFDGAHGGSICVSDNPPHGTVFTFTLPKGEVTLNE